MVIGLQRRTMGAMLRLRPGPPAVGGSRRRSLCRSCTTGMPAVSMRKPTHGPTGCRSPRRISRAGHPAGHPSRRAVAVHYRAQANRQERAMRLEDAERIYRQILDMLQDSASSPLQARHIAALTTASARSPSTGAGWMRPRTGTASPWPQRRPRGPARDGAPVTTPSAMSPTYGAGWTRPRTGTASP